MSRPLTLASEMLPNVRGGTGHGEEDLLVLLQEYQVSFLTYLIFTFTFKLNFDFWLYFSFGGYRGCNKFSLYILVAVQILVKIQLMICYHPIKGKNHQKRQISNFGWHLIRFHKLKNIKFGLFKHRSKKYNRNFMLSHRVDPKAPHCTEQGILLIISRN